MATVVLRRGAEGAVLAGHPWVFRNQVARQLADEGHGEWVDVLDADGRFLGRGDASWQSQIVARILTRADVPLDRDLFLARVRRAWDLRRKLLADTSACRVVHAEADFLPGLTVDSFADWLVVSALTVGMARRLPLLVDVLREVLAPRGIYERDDAPVRAREGLPAVSGLLWGEPPPADLVVRENGVDFGVDLACGQKTGFYLDQRDNRRLVGSLSAGARVLDAFCYVGGFGVTAAVHGAAAVVGVDSSDWAVAQAAGNADRNGVADRCRWQVANAFDYLRELDRAGERFDVVVLDPPPFARSRSNLEAAWRGYKEINLRGCRLLRPGGLLVTCTCSHHVDPASFAAVVDAAAADAGRWARVVATGTAGADHPVLLAVPTTRYLTCLVLAVD